MSKKMRLIMAGIIAIGVVTLVMACTTETEPPDDIDPPVIHSLVAEAERVFPLESIQIVCTASGYDDGELSYEWWASRGDIDGQDSTATWTAPSSEGTYAVGVIVTDSGGRGVADQLDIIVQANQPPVINSLTGDAEWVFPGGTVLVQCDAEDPDGHPLSYDWSASAGDIEGMGSEITWIAPGEIGIYSITVTVHDGYGGAAMTTLHVSVMSEQPPVIEALDITADHPYLVPLGSKYRVAYEQEYTIQCIASHPDGYQLSYEWSCSGGQITEVSEDGSTISWVAPDTYANVIVTVVVSDIVSNNTQESLNLEVVSRSACGG